MATKLQKLRVWSGLAAGLAQKPHSLFYSLDDFQFLSDAETIRHLQATGKGITRFGDGELNFTAGYPAIHQKPDPALRARLLDILREYDGTQPYLLALPLDLLLTGNYAERHSTPENWRAPRFATLPYLKKGVLYGSPFCFRLQNVIDNDHEKYKEQVYSLFKEKDIIYVGNNSTINNSITPTRIISIAERDAYKDHDRIKKEITEAAAEFINPLILLSTGVTATALSAELNDRGILAYDIGSLFDH